MSEHEAQSFGSDRCELVRYLPPENQRRPSPYVSNIYQFGPSEHLPLQEAASKNPNQVQLIVGVLDSVARQGIELTPMGQRCRINLFRGDRYRKARLLKIKAKSSAVRAVAVRETICGVDSLVILAVGTVKKGKGERAYQVLADKALARLEAATLAVHKRNERFASTKASTQRSGWKVHSWKEPRT